MVNKKEKNECSGSYEVSGYTTGDGKKVDSYTRNCWKHGKVSESKTQDTENISGKLYEMQSEKNNNDGETNPIWGGLDLAYRIYESYLNRNKYMTNSYTPIEIRKEEPTQNTKDKKYEFSTFDTKTTEEKIKETLKKTEEIRNKRIITKEDISKINNQTQMVMHNLFDDVEDLSVQKSNLSEIPTVESSEEAQKIENDRKQIRENAYQTILMLYQQRNVVEKQWKKVSTKDAGYDSTLNQYIEKKQEIEKLCDTVKDLFDYASKIDDTTLEKVKKLRDELGLMRLRPILPKKQVEPQQKWIWPCKGEISSGYGWRIHPITQEKTFHTGIDIKVKVGTPVRAIADGKVSAARSGMTGYGTGVFIDHGKVDGKNVRSEYGHLSRYCVKYGQYVKQGQIIGYSGNTGWSTGEHLHLTIRISLDNINFKHDDPFKYLEKN